MERSSVLAAAAAAGTAAGVLLGVYLARKMEEQYVPENEPVAPADDANPASEWLSFKAMYRTQLGDSYKKIMAINDKLVEFVAAANQKGQKLVVVTCGGTAVPLEKNMVRYIDNFSSGGRGSACAAGFLASGYAIVFVHRETQQVKPHRDFYSNPNVLSLPFFSVYEYLLLLELTHKAIVPMGPKAMVFLAAAVADFYMEARDLPDVVASGPSGQKFQITVGMPSDKIQSRDISGLTLFLQNTPKMLKWIKGTQDLAGKGLDYSWSPDAFVVSFKLETDKDILMAKAAKSLKMYHQDVVVANMLQDYKNNCQLVFPKEPRGWDRIDVQDMVVKQGIKHTLLHDDHPSGLNRTLVENVAELHDGFINKA